MPQWTNLIEQLLMVGFAPAMILAPLITVVCLRPNPTEQDHRVRYEILLKQLIIATVLSLLFWAVLFFYGPMLNRKISGAFLTGFLFSPLWIKFAAPAIASNNSIDATNPTSANSGNTTRTASLVNRHRISPIKPWYWTIAISIYLISLLAIGARGLYPFENIENVTDTSSVGATGQMLFYRWINLLVSYAFIFGVMLAIAPKKIIGASLTEAEPLLPQGCEQLAQAYKERRDWTTLNLFWLLLVLMPATLGLLYGLMVWQPRNDQLVGILGSIGGAVGGILGAWIGILGSRKRSRIEKLKAELGLQNTPQATNGV
ncbi:MAG: hypothetical protein ACKN85_06730 [Pirellula sp.]